MFYPGNYGFIPHTLADDGDPMDILVVGPTPVVPGAVIRCRPIGRADDGRRGRRGREDPGGAGRRAAPLLHGRGLLARLPSILTEQIAHFFPHYKDLEKGKSTEIVRWADAEEAADLIRVAIKRAAETDTGAA